VRRSISRRSTRRRLAIPRSSAPKLPMRKIRKPQRPQLLPNRFPSEMKSGIKARTHKPKAAPQSLLNRGSQKVIIPRCFRLPGPVATTILPMSSTVSTAISASITKPVSPLESNPASPLNVIPMSRFSLYHRTGSPNRITRQVR